MVHIIDSKNSILNQFIAEIRNKEIHNDSMRFRRNLERIAEIMAYEISKEFDYMMTTVHTPINPAQVMVPAKSIVIASVLRAGLPFHNGFLNVFDHAESAFISARREYESDHKTFTIKYDSVYSPSLENKYLLLVDPMLATGGSLSIAYDELIQYAGKPAKTIIASVISSRQGLDFISDKMSNENASIYLATLDEKLTDAKYIDPGIGDAGDLAYGPKL